MQKRSGPPTGSTDWSFGKSIGVGCCDATFATCDEAEAHEQDQEAAHIHLEEEDEG